MNKMHLSPVLLAVVAIATSLDNSLSATAQTPNSEQVTEVSTLETNQLLPQETSQNSKNQKSDLISKAVVIKTESPQATSEVQVLTANSTSIATPEIIVPTPATTTNSEALKAALSKPITTPEVIVPTPATTTNSEALKAALSKPIATPEIIVPTPATTANSKVLKASLSKPIATTEVIVPTPAKTANSAQVLQVKPIAATQVISRTATTNATQFAQTEPSTTPDTNPSQETQENVEQPTVQPVFPATPETPETPEASETRVLVSEVAVKSPTGTITPKLESEVYRVIRTQPGQTTTRSQLQQDINAIFATGFFSNVQAMPEDTPLGVRVSFVVNPNPILTKVEVNANPGTGVNSVTSAAVVDEIFREQYGKILNLRDLQEGIKKLTKQYQDKGYVLANVIGTPKVAENGVVTLQVAEGVVENIKVRFRNKNGEETDDKGQPIRGRTKEYIITRELQLKPGQVFNRNIVQKDIQRVFGLGLFEDVNVSLDPGTDPSKVDVVLNVAERSSGSIAAGAGISSASGLFGTISYQQQNLNGRNQKLGAEVQLGERELLFDLRFTDPWIAGDPYRTSYTTNIFRRSSISLIFEGKDRTIDTFDPNNITNQDKQDRPRIVRSGGGISFTRPLSRNPYERSEWLASAGLQYQRVSARDADGDLRKQGAIFNNNGNIISPLVPLTQSSSGEDDLLLLQLGAQRDRRNNALQPTSGNYLRFGVDQSVPIGQGNIFLTRVRGNYSQYVPVKFLSFGKGPQTLAFNIQGGTVLGDLPPYEAFTLGGSNSVRGYDEGRLASGRSYVQASVEYRFPVFSVVSGALFLDYGSDLGTSTRAAEVLNKNGSGYGYGLGVRVQSPLGPIRIDYGLSDDGDSRINFGIGERF
jgi:outer membrane protein insertion porin family